MSGPLDMLDQLDFAAPDQMDEAEIQSQYESCESGDGFGDGEFEAAFGAMPSPENEQASVLMELMVDQLAEAEGDGEADQFLPLLAGLAPLAMKAIPAIARVAAPAVKRALPHLARGIVNVGRQIIQSPQARQLVRALPTVARNTAADVLNTYAQTGQLDAATVKRATARQAAKVLRVPANRRCAIRRNMQICSRRLPKPRPMLPLQAW